MSMLIFLLWLAILLAEGWMFTRVLLRRDDRWLCLTLALPMAAVLNAVLFAKITLVSLPLSPLVLIIYHLTTLAVTAVLFWKVRGTGVYVPQEPTPFLSVGRFRALVTVLCSVILLQIVAFSFTHSVIIPTHQIDSLTNWTMRSKISFIDQELAFDKTEERGIAKPQYPFLFHSLQIVVNEGNETWNDRAANAILFLLSLSAFAAIGLLLARLRSWQHGLIGVTLIASIPLMAYHLEHGYGDIHLVEYAALSLLLLIGARERRSVGWLLVSGVMAAGAAWSKSEGLFVGLIFWMMMSVVLLRGIVPAKILGLSLAAAWLFWLQFPTLMYLKGLGLTPHGSDTALEMHFDMLPAALQGIFAAGSFGMLWTVLFVSFILFLIGLKKKHPGIDRVSFATVLWGIAVLLLILFTYTMTANAEFLRNGQSFQRQLMIPAVLLILSLLAAWKPRSGR